jgi:hypothetical protein
MTSDVSGPFEALLLAPVLRELFPSDGALGDYGADLFAQEVAAQLERRT